MSLPEPLPRDWLQKQIDDACIEAIEPEVWDRIRHMEAGQNEYGYDPFGFEPEFLKYVIPLVKYLHRSYFRTRVVNVENIPDSGRVLLIANHSGQIPLDGVLMGAATLLDKRPPRMIRSMIEHWMATLPFFSWLFARMGQVIGTRENCRRLLRRGGCIGVFPEGIRGSNKTYDNAYELQRFGFGFMRLALETDTPIVPVGIVGGEEQHPAIWDVETIADLLNMPAFPLTPTWPWLGPAGAIPLPVKYHIHFGEPLHFEGASDDENRVIKQKVDRVKDSIRELIRQGLDEREGVFW